MTLPIQIKLSKQLLVEGKTQQNFFEALINKLNLDGLQIQDFGGVRELRGFLLALKNSSNFNAVESIGIVRDAVEGLAVNACRSVESALRNADLPIPDESNSSNGENLAVRVFILPNNADTGMLETLLCETIENDDLVCCIDSFFECVGDLPGISKKRRDKARAQVFLSTKDNPGCSVGVAAKKGYWNLEHEAFDGVRKFLNSI